MRTAEQDQAFEAYIVANPNDPVALEVLARREAAEKAGFEAGFTAAVKAERERIADVIQAAGENRALAVESIIAGHSADAVKFAAGVVSGIAANAQADAKERSDALAAKDAEIARLRIGIFRPAARALFQSDQENADARDRLNGLQNPDTDE